MAAWIYRAMIEAAPPAPVEDDAVGCAEREVGRFFYNRISALMDAELGTGDAIELAYLAQIVSDVEEYGADGTEVRDSPWQAGEAQRSPAPVEPVPMPVHLFRRPEEDPADYQRMIDIARITTDAEFAAELAALAPIDRAHLESIARYPAPVEPMRKALSDEDVERAALEYERLFGQPGYDTPARAMRGALKDYL